MGKDNEEVPPKMVRSPAMPEGFSSDNWKSQTKIIHHIGEKV